MNKSLAMDFNFTGEMLSTNGNVQTKGLWDGVKKGLLTCALCWVFGAFFMFIPIANWTMPAVFWMFGPVLGLAVAYSDRRYVSKLDARVQCPRCNSDFEIHEKNVATPVYGSCPSCKSGYHMSVPRLEYRQSRNRVADPRHKEYVPTDSAINMKALQGRGAFFEEEAGEETREG